MTPPTAIFILISSTALLALPRRWVMLPLLVGGCYLGLTAGTDIGPFHFTALRLLIFAGVLRILLRRERPSGGFIGMDWLVLAWIAWALCSSFLRKNPSETLVFHLGRAYNLSGIYFLIRCFIQSEKDAVRAVKIIAILLVPVALEMVLEKVTDRNQFAIFGGVPATPEIRHGRIRSQGPFAHPILAGTVGAVCIPLMIGIWRKHPLVAKTGLAACLVIAATTASSGPLMILVVGVFALLLWRWRHLTHQMRVAAVVGYILLDLVMKAPAYFLMDRLDIFGGSNGWHRAALIQAAITHLSRWWLAGTDYTRDWMPYGVSWSPHACDITNHYIGEGVHGGLLLMLIFIGFLWCGFRYVGQILRAKAQAPFEDRFFIWSLGASLFAYAIGGISIAYWDQSIMFLYFTLAILPSLRHFTFATAAAPLEHAVPPLAGAQPAVNEAFQIGAISPRPGNT